MRVHPGIAFLAGMATVFVYHKYVKPMPSSATA